MKKLTLFLAALIAVISVQGQDAYKIGVKIKGLKNGDELLLANYFGEQTLRKDTGYVGKDGYAYFTGDEKLPRGMYLVATKDLKVFEMLIDSDQEFKISTDSAKLLWYKNMKVDGSKANQMFLDYRNFITGMVEERNVIMNKQKVEKDSVKLKELNERLSELDKQVTEYRNNLMENEPDELLTKFFKGHTDPKIPEEMQDAHDSVKVRYYKDHYWDNFDFNEEGLVRAPDNLIPKKIDEYIDRLVYPHPDSFKVACDYLIGMAEGNKELDRYFIWYLGQKFQKSKIMCFDDVYVHLAREYYCKGRAWWVEKELLDKICEEANKASYVQCYQKAPDMVNLDTAGREKQLSKLAGTYTFVFFWDPTCSHCKKVVPLLDSIYDANKDKGWTVYAIASQNKEKEWREYLRKHPEIHDWVNVCQVSKYYPWPYKRQEYNNISNPTIYILDENMKIIAKKIQEDKVAEFMEHRLKLDNQIKGDPLDKGVGKVDAPKDDINSVTPVKKTSTRAQDGVPQAKPTE